MRPIIRRIDELPFAHHLSRSEDTPEAFEDHSGTHFDGFDLTDLGAEGAQFTQVAITDVNLSEGHLARSRFDEVWIHQTQLIGTDLAETHWVDSQIHTSVLAGTALFDAQLRRVTFVGCKLTGVNLRGAELRDVAFVDCLLREVDFSDAKMTDVRFPGSTVDNIRLDKAALCDVDLRDASAIGIESGYRSLNGLIISPTQLLDLAHEFALALGVTVSSDERSG